MLLELLLVSCCTGAGNDLPSPAIPPGKGIKGLYFIGFAQSVPLPGSQHFVFPNIVVQRFVKSKLHHIRETFGFETRMF